MLHIMRKLLIKTETPNTLSSVSASAFSSNTTEAPKDVSAALSRRTQFAAYSLKQQYGILLFSTTQAYQEGFVQFEEDFNSTINYYQDIIEQNQKTTDKKYIGPDSVVTELELYKIKFKLLEANHFSSDEMKENIAKHLETINNLIETVTSFKEKEETEEDAESRLRM